MIIGIDPGLAGAFAFLEPDTRRLAIHRMPVTVGKSGKQIVDLHGVARLVGDPRWALATRMVGVLENVTGHATGSLTSAFNFGLGLGAVQMALVMAGAELQQVTAPAWKKHHGLVFPKGTPPAQVKSASRSLAARMFPAYSDEFKLVKDDGKAEACLIAAYGAEKWG